ncbi:MAG: LLM class flavin-dependent oxidoreductase [Chloroflexi bacterium]|nr:LLM class flavin-dependent oxidoreductase [Chloroflexota bacterium]
MLHAPADAEERARTAGGAERRGQAYRNPALTAKIAATLQVLTHGRFILGLGAGDAEAEHRAYGFPFPGASRRVEQLDEAAAIVRLLWTRDAATFQGKHYRVEQAVCLPRPAPPPALMIGGAGERRTLRVVARHAEWVELRLLQSRRVRAEARRATRTLPCDRARPRRGSYPPATWGSPSRTTPSGSCAAGSWAIAGRCTWSVARPTRSPGSWRHSARRASGICHSTSWTTCARTASTCSWTGCSRALAPRPHEQALAAQAATSVRGKDEPRAEPVCVEGEMERAAVPPALQWAWYTQTENLREFCPRVQGAQPTWKFPRELPPEGTSAYRPRTRGQPRWWSVAAGRTTPGTRPRAAPRRPLQRRSGR